MDIYFSVILIPMLCIAILLWVLCCYLAKIHRRAEGWPPTLDDFPSVFVIPISEEQLRDQEVVDAQEEPRLFPHRDPPINFPSRGVSPPPPYGMETPAGQDPPPSWDPPAYSELQ